jgi:predicted ArsR family transcriptional regulator
MLSACDAGGMASVIDLLPATAPEIAAELGITLRHANARLQHFAARGKCRRTERAIPPIEKTRGRYPHIWEAA